MSGCSPLGSAVRQTTSSRSKVAARSRLIGSSLLPSWGVIVLLSCSGCEHSSPAELASLDAINPTEIEVGEQLTLSGSGFIVGPASLELEGTLSAPGQDRTDQETMMILPVLATSPTTASARLSRRHLDRTSSGHMTFSGRGTLRFASAAGPDAPHVIASLDEVRLELFSGPAAHQAQSRINALRGQAMLDELGVTAAPLPEAQGVLIERLRSGAGGTHVGLLPGEVIVTSGNVTVASVADLAPPLRTDSVVLGIRDVNGRVRLVECPLNPSGFIVDKDRIAAFAIAICALLVILVIAGPFRGAIGWVGAQIVEGSNGPREILRLFTDGGRERPLASLVSMFLFASAPFVVMALAHFGIVPVAGLAVLASAIAGITATRGWRRLVAAISASLRTTPLVMAAAIAAVRAASMDVHDIVNAQGPLPWTWNALADPASLLLLVVLCASTCSGSPARIGPSVALLRGIVGAFIVALLLGGWQLSTEQALGGQILFAVKAWAIGLCMLHGGRSQVIAVVVVASLLAAAVLALNLLPLPPWAPSALTWSTAATAVFIVLPLTIRAIVTPPSTPTRPEVVPGATNTHGSRSTHKRVPSLGPIPGHS